MGKRRKGNMRVLLSLLLILTAALVFLWPFDRQNAAPKSDAAGTAPAETAAVPSGETVQTLPGMPEPESTPVPSDADAGKIRVSELMVKNRATLPDEDGDFPDWIELENISGDAVELTGWQLRDGAKKPCWLLPETWLQPGERLLILADGKDRGYHTDFSLSAGETLQIYTANGCPVAELLCPDGESDVAWIPDGQGGWESSLYPTPGIPNTAENYELLMASRVTDSPLVINEVCTYNKTARWKALVGISDWIELKNVSDRPVELSEYYVSDDVDQRLLWQLPAKTLDPGEMFLIMCNEEESLLGAAPLCMAFSLNSTADRVYLSRGDGSLADYVSLRDIPYLGSYGRMAGENGFFFLPEPSPGKENFGGARRVSAMPGADSPDGVFDDVQSVTVSLHGTGAIRYTVDGSAPNESSPLYTGPITLTETGMVRAYCQEPGALPSRTLTLNYILNESFTLPVVCLVSDNKALQNAYYNRYKGVEVPCSLSFYEEGGGFSIPCGASLHGETSLVLPKKNLSLRFRGSYGQEELQYDVFGDGGVCEFTNLLLRAGQDYYHAIVRNELCTELARSLSDRMLISRNRYCILYMDGKYMGIYAMGEKLNEAMYAHQAGVGRDSVVTETPPMGPRFAMYREVFTFAMENDLAKPENYEEICRRLDVDGFIDWLILEGCFGNDDLTYGNIRYCRSLETDGKWHLMFYDLDSTFNHVDSCFSNVLSPWARQTRQFSQLADQLLRNAQFRRSLLSRASELIPQLSNERILQELDTLAAIIDPEVARDYERNAMDKSSWEWNVQWIRDYVQENDWNLCCLRNFCYYLNVTDEERAEFFPQL